MRWEKRTREPLLPKTFATQTALTLISTGRCLGTARLALHASAANREGHQSASLVLSLVLSEEILEATQILGPNRRRGIGFTSVNQE